MIYEVYSIYKILYNLFKMEVDKQNKELPMIVFFTGKYCGHCIDFRGADGVPSKDSSRKWNLEYIRRLLNYPGSNFEKHNAELIVELHFDNFDTILQVNIYSLIPTINEIKQRTRFDPNIPGSAVEHIAITRGPNNIINVNVNVNGNYDRELTDIYKNKYIWSNIPTNLCDIRMALKHNDVISPEMIKNIQNRDIRNFINNNISSMKRNVGIFESYIMRYYNYDLFLKKNVANKICNYKNYVPCWMILLKSEWDKSILTNESIYARVVNNKTILRYGKYDIIPFTQNENIERLIDKYHSSDMKLEYVASSKLKKTYAWQRKLTK